jgi:hypothetical protein
MLLSRIVARTLHFARVSERSKKRVLNLRLLTLSCSGQIDVNARNSCDPGVWIAMDIRIVYDLNRFKQGGILTFHHQVPTQFSEASRR